MRHLFIKSGKNGYEFAMTTNDFKNRDVVDLDNYSFEESELQVISNGHFFIFYQDMYRIDMAYLKMLFEEELDDKSDLDVRYIRDELIFKIKDTLAKVYRLSIGEPSEKTKDRFYGLIVIVTQTSIYRIYTNFQVDTLDEFIDNGNVEIISVEEIMGNPSPKELMNKFVCLSKEDNSFINYPLIYGNTNQDFITLVDSNNDAKECAAEDFVCRW